MGDERKWFVPFYVDVGTGQSKLTWQINAGVGYQFDWGALVASWRYLDYSFKSDSKFTDLFEATAHEATRLKPIVPVIYLETVADVVLGDVAIPKGTPLFFVLRPAMLDERHFGRPGEFLPERWSTGHDAVQPHDTRAYTQFGAGPRVCPGRHLAGVELRLVLSMLARNFSVEPTVDTASVKELLNFTMMPSAMPVRLKPLVH